MSSMTKTKNTAISDNALDMEISDVLIAISVISRQLAKKITAKYMSKEANANEK